VFDPVYVRAITQGKTFELIEKLRLYPPLNKQSIISSLKSSWCVYKARASLVISEDIDVVQWHYQCWLDNNEYLTDETYWYQSCLHCECSKHRSCSCIQNCMSWWETAATLALILPSSVPAERVFSILHRMWSDLQTHALSDVIRTSMFLACNGRSL
jgi:hypothetical protein